MPGRSDEDRRPFGALDGLTVIDLTAMLSGPYCSMMLADQGARSSFIPEHEIKKVWNY